MTPLEELAAKLRTFWLRDIGASQAPVSGAAADGSVALARTLFVPSAGGLVGINQIPTDPYALDIVGHVRIAGNVYARAGNQWTIGEDGAPWGAIYASELHVGSLIAENKVATTGGRILVAPSTKLILAVTTGATTIDVASNALATGDIIYLESTGRLEWMRINSTGTPVTGGYRFTVIRNLNGAGAQTWSAGDAVLNTQSPGKGWIDLYSRYGIPAAGETSTTRVGPAIVGLQRQSTTYNDFGTRWAVGNLNGLYGYGDDVAGFAAGRQQLAWVAIDDSNGFRLMNNATVLGQWTAAGGITVGEVAAGRSNIAISSGQLDVRSNATNRISLTSAGILTVRNSSGNAVFTFDSNAGAEFTLPLTLGAAGGIYQGTGTFASPTTGLKIYNASGIGLIAGYNTGTLQWYADTDGKLYAGAGMVKLDANGMTLTKGTYYTEGAALKWGNSDVSIYGFYGSPSNKLRMTVNQAGSGTGAVLEMFVDGGATGGGYGEIALATSGNGTIGYLYLRNTGNHTLTGNLGFLGATSGTAKLQAAAVAGTPTLTLPTTTGTLALTSDVAAAVTGTTGKLAKFTGANTVGDSLISESGSVVTTTGAHTITGLLQAGTKILDISRDVAGGAIGNYTEIGNFSNTYGAHALRITLSISQSGVSIAKEYLVVTKSAQTSSWVICPATRNTGYSGFDVHLIAMQSAAALNLRIVVFRNNNPATLTFNVCIENVGVQADTWTAMSATGSMTVPTAILVSSTDVHTLGGGYVLTRAIPTTVGNYIEIGTINGANGNGALDIWMSNVDNSFVVSKRYVIPLTYAHAPSWCIVQPITSTGPYSGNDAALVVLQSSTGMSLRLLRTAGTTAGTMIVWLANAGDYAHFWDEASATGSMAVPTIFHQAAIFSQVNAKAGLNVIAPSALWHVVGASDVVQEIVKANATQTSDLSQWHDSSASVVARITGAGKFVALTPTSSNASIRLPAGTAPSAPGDGDVWHDSTRKAEYGFFAGIAQGRVGAIFTQTADATVGNTVTETTLLASGVGTLSLPANFWTVSKTVRISLSGYWSQTGSSPTRTVKVYLGATTMLNVLPSTFGGGVTNQGFKLELVMTCRTTGASGTVYTQGRLFLGGNNTYGLATTAAVTVDTTAAKSIDVKWIWGTADPSNTITVTNALVEVLQ